MKTFIFNFSKTAERAVKTYIQGAEVLLGFIVCFG